MNSLALILLLLMQSIFIVWSHGASSTSEKDVNENIHIALLSGRINALSVTVATVCSSTKMANDRLTYHIFGDEIEATQSALSDIEACKGAQFNVVSVATATKELIDSGFNPVWEYIKVEKGMKYDGWGVKTPYVHDKHAIGLNLLRFYLPHLSMFNGVSKIVFLDDDVLVQKDISTLVHMPSRQSTALLAGCQHWEWKNGSFKNSFSLSVRASGYIGNLGTVCSNEDIISPDANCVSPNIEEDIKTLSLAAEMTEDHPFFASRPLDRQAFNLGLNVIDTKQWFNVGVTHRFEHVMEKNLDLKLFPPDTLAFGLGLGYFAVGDSFECYDSKVTHVTGLSFIPKKDLDEAGFTVDELQEEAFALHYNGAEKPWEVSFDHLCGEESMPVVAIDIWMRQCIDLHLCSCSSISQVSRATKRRGLRTLTGGTAVPPGVSTTSTSSSEDDESSGDSDDKKSKKKRSKGKLFG